MHPLLFNLSRNNDIAKNIGPRAEGCIGPQISGPWIAFSFCASAPFIRIHAVGVVGFCKFSNRCMEPGALEVSNERYSPETGNGR